MVREGGEKREQEEQWKEARGAKRGKLVREGEEEREQEKQWKEAKKQW